MKALLILSSFFVSTIFSMTSFAEVRVDSAYTPLTGCAVLDASSLDPDAEIDYMTVECAGLGGYRPSINGGDIRYDLSLNYGESLVISGGVLTSAFHDVGQQAEWRYEVTDRSDLVYTALIYRLSYQADVNVNTSTLVVIRLDKENSCIIGLVPASNNMNQLARDIADDKSAACLVDPAL